MNETAAGRSGPQSGSAGGPAGEERTTVEVRTLGELLTVDDVDWATLCVVSRVLLGPGGVT